MTWNCDKFSRWNDHFLNENSYNFKNYIYSKKKNLSKSYSGENIVTKNINIKIC
jgi:hypothetical protein